MKDLSFTYRTEDAHPLYVHGWAPEGEPRAVLQILHGMAEHAGRYARLAETFTADGFAVYGHDHRGHGRSVPPGQSHGHVADQDCFGQMVRDAHAVNQELRARHPGLPVVLLGHSMGSFVAQTMLFWYPGDCTACALSGSSGAPPAIAKAGRLVARGERARLGARGVSPILRALSFDDFNKAFAPNRTKFDWLSRDEKEVDLYVADPFCGFDCDVGLWIDMLDALDDLVHDRRFQARIDKSLPILLFAGDRDPVGEFGSGVRKLHDEYRRAGIRDLTMILYPGARHETLNETNREQVTKDLLTWAKRVAHV